MFIKFLLIASFILIPHLAHAAAAQVTEITIANLRANTTTATDLVRVLGYLAAADGGGGTFVYNPLDTTSADNGGTIIVDAINHRWYRQLEDGAVTIEQFGGVNHAVDVTANLLAAATSVSKGFGSRVVLGQNVYLIGASGNLDMSALSNVEIVGNAAVTGTVPNNATAVGTLLLNAASTILPGHQFYLHGFRVTRQGITTPTTLRAAISEVANFAGTAITVQNTTDVKLRDLAINGFSQGIYGTSSLANAPYANQFQRLTMENIVGDDTNFIWVDNCYDACTIDHAEAWPFVVAASGLVGNQTSQITNISSSGGLIELTLASAPATPYVTGDIVVVGSATQLASFTASISGNVMTVSAVASGQVVPQETIPISGVTRVVSQLTSTASGGTLGTTGTYFVTPAQQQNSGPQTGIYLLPGTNGRWTITVIDATHLTLRGSTFTAYTGTPTTGQGQAWSISGQAFVYMGAGQRYGKAYAFTNAATPYNPAGNNVGGEFATNLWDYSHDTGFYIGPNHGPVSVGPFWVDGDSQNNSFADNVPVGIDDEGLGGTFTAGSVCCNARSVVVNQSSSGAILAANLPISGLGAIAGVVGSALDVTSGNVSVTGGIIGGNLNNGSNLIYVGDGAIAVSLSNENINAYALRTTAVFESAPDCWKFTINSEAECPWSPAFAATGATFTYASPPTGLAVLIGDQMTLYGNIAVSTVAGGSTNPTFITGLPFPPSFNSACSIGAATGISFTAGFSQFTIAADAGIQALGFNEVGNNTPTFGVGSANINSNAYLQFSCSFPTTLGQ